MTQKEWKEVMGYFPEEFNWDELPIEFQVEGAVSDMAKKLAEKTKFIGDDLPVERVSWDAVKVFVQKLSPWGLYDMAGNVGEWTSTIADMAPYERRFPGRKFGPGTSRVYKGSHYLHTKFAAFSDYAHTYRQALPRGCVGFRVVREK